MPTYREHYGDDHVPRTFEEQQLIENNPENLNEKPLLEDL